MKAFSLIMVGAVLASTFVACKKDNNTVHPEDIDFLVAATYANKAEIIAGNLAVSKGMRDSIRIFGQLMVTDHTAAQKTVDSLAALSGIVLPAAPDSLHQAVALQLTAFSGYTFDTAYIHRQVYDQQSVIRILQDEVSDGHNVQIKNFAGDWLPQVRLHYFMAASISNSE